MWLGQSPSLQVAGSLCTVSDFCQLCTVILLQARMCFEREVRSISPAFSCRCSRWYELTTAALILLHSPSSSCRARL